MKYKIINVINCDKIEQLGTKTKFWFYDDVGNIKLFKIGRPGTGENWSEKATSELAKLLRIPCASYDFAIWDGNPGVVSPSFVPEHGALQHGNQILGRVFNSYPDPDTETRKTYQIREYTLGSVLAVMKLLKVFVKLPIGYQGNDTIKNIADLFIGYLMFDCWVANLDRHHANWGLVSDGSDKKIHLAPSYDHASGLGCRVSPEECEKRLTTNDKRYSVEAFVKRGKSAFFAKDSTRIKLIDVFTTSSNLNKKAAIYWIKQLETVDIEAIRTIFRQIPTHLISPQSSEFATQMLIENRRRLVALKRNIL